MGCKSCRSFPQGPWNSKSACSAAVAAFTAAATFASTAVSSAVHVGLGLRKSATRGETMPVAKRVNAWYVHGKCVARALVWHVHGV